MLWPGPQRRLLLNGSHWRIKMMMRMMRRKWTTKMEAGKTSVCLKFMSCSDLSLKVEIIFWPITYFQGFTSCILGCMKLYSGIRTFPSFLSLGFFGFEKFKSGRKKIKILKVDSIAVSLFKKTETVAATLWKRQCYNISFPLHKVRWPWPVSTTKDKCTIMKEKIETNMKQERKREIHVPTNLRQLKERSGSRYQWDLVGNTVENQNKSMFPHIWGSEWKRL